MIAVDYYPESFFLKKPIHKAKTASARLRRFLKLHGREIAALASGAAVGALGAGFATYYYDSKKMKRNDDAHAQMLKEVAAAHEKEQKRLSEEYMAQISEITSAQTKSLQEKDAALKEAADNYQQQLDTKDKANAAEIERLRKTFETESRKAHEAMAAKVEELEEALEKRNQEQAAQLELFHEQQKALFDHYNDQQLAKLDDLKSGFSEFAEQGRQRAEELMAAFLTSDDHQREALAANLSQYLVKQDELLQEIQKNKRELQEEFTQHIDMLKQNFNEAYGQLNQSLAYLQQMSMYGIWQANLQAEQVRQQLQALTTQHAEATNAAKQQYQAQQEQLAQMAVAAHTQRAALEELSEQGRKSRNADRMSIVKKSYVQNGGDESLIRSHDAVMQQIAGLRKEAGEGHLTAHDIANSKRGYKMPSTSIPNTSKWALQSNGQYKKIELLKSVPASQGGGVTPSAGNKPPYDSTRDQASLAALESQEKAARAAIAIRRNGFMTVPRTVEAMTGSAVVLPTIRTGGNRGQAAGGDTRALVPFGR